jgi:hypothetical protein
VRLVSGFVRPALELWLNQHVDYGRKLAELANRLMEAKAAKNTYLAGLEIAPPTGEERKAINAAFDTLVSEIKTRETDRGVAMFRGDQPESPSLSDLNAERIIRRVLGRGADLTGPDGSSEDRSASKLGGGDRTGSNLGLGDHRRSKLNLGNAGILQLCGRDAGVDQGRRADARVGELRRGDNAVAKVRSANKSPCHVMPS